MAAIEIKVNGASPSARSIARVVVGASQIIVGLGSAALILLSMPPLALVGVGQALIGLGIVRRRHWARVTAWISFAAMLLICFGFINQSAVGVVYLIFAALLWYGGPTFNRPGAVDVEAVAPAHSDYSSAA